MEIISAHWILPLNHLDVLREGGMVIEKDTILEVGPLADLKARHPEAKHRHFENAAILPGLVNAHCHLDRAGFFERFTVETDTAHSTVAWLLEGLRYLSRTATAQVSRRMEEELDHLLKTGVTCLGAMAHFEGTYPLLKSKKTRGVVFQEILSGPDKRAQQRFEVALALLDQYDRAKPDHLVMGLGPYAAYLLSRNLLKIISHHARDKKIPLQMHLAESFAEMEFFYESSGEIATELFPAVGWDELPPAHRKTPVQHLQDIGFFTTPFSLVGGYHMSAADFPRLARGLARVVFCPSANRRFRLGTLPLKEFREQGIPVALGTEISSPSGHFDLWHEMRLALREGSSPLPKPLEVLKMATRGGALALGFDHCTGSLAPNMKADYIVVRTPEPAPADLDELCREIILQTEEDGVRRVVIGGETVKD